MNETIIIAVFFFYTIVGVFFGDGRQPFVDVWMGAGILLCLVLARRIKTATSVISSIYVLWGAVLIGMAILTVFSDSAGYSVSATTRYVEGFLVLILFSRLSWRETGTWLFNVVVFFAVISSYASLVLVVVPRLAEFLPLMNLLFGNYGHSHVADILLFSLPVVIYWFVSKPNWYRAGAFIVCVIAFLLSFARGAWVVFLLYLSVQFVLRKKEHAKKGRPLLLGMVLIFIAALGFITFLSFVYKDGHVKNVSWPHQQIIKPLPFQDNRFVYWGQALRAIAERPWFGSGPGTFLLQSRRLQWAPETWSWYAHSFPLQTMVELGLIGSVPVFVLFIVLLSSVFRIIINNKEDGERRTMAWGLALTFIYSLFEFNLNFSVIWLLFWATTAVLLNKHKAEHSQNEIWLNRGIKLLTSVGIVMLGVFCLTSIVSVIMQIYMKRFDVAFLVAPFDAGNAEKYLENVKENKLNIAKKETFFIHTLHKKNSDMYQYFIDVAKNDLEKQLLMEQVTSLDPWKRKEFDLTKYYFRTRQLELAQKQIEKTRLLWFTAEKQRGFRVAHVDKHALSEQMLELGDGYYEQQKPQDAARWYGEAQLMDDWALDAHRPAFLDYSLPAINKLDFFSGLGKIPGQKFGQYQEVYVHEYLTSLRDSVRTLANINIPAHIQKIVQFAPWIRSQAWEEIGLSLLENARENQKKGRYQDALVALTECVDVWKALVGGGQSVEWKLQNEVAGELVHVGTLLAPSKLTLTIQAYKQATLLVPWIVSEKGMWFNTLTASDIERGSLQSLVDMTDATDELVEKNSAYSILFLVEKDLHDQDFSASNEYINKSFIISLADYESRKKTSIKLQRVTDQFILDKNIPDAEKTITIMNKIFPEDYWSRVQPANFYIMAGNLTKAKLSYRNCLALSNGNHTDCQKGLDELEKGKINASRYWQVSQIIQGNARWQDFM